MKGFKYIITILLNINLALAGVLCYHDFKETSGTTIRSGICTINVEACMSYMKAYYNTAPSAFTITDNCNGEWYVFQNSQNRDRDNELRSYVGNFKEAKANGDFHKLCGAADLYCHYVIDWEGHYKSCGENPNDGSRVAYCAKTTIPLNQKI